MQRWRSWRLFFQHISVKADAEPDVCLCEGACPSLAPLQSHPCTEDNTTVAVAKWRARGWRRSCRGDVTSFHFLSVTARVRALFFLLPPIEEEINLFIRPVWGKLPRASRPHQAALFHNHRLKVDLCFPFYEHTWGVAQMTGCVTDWHGWGVIAALLSHRCRPALGLHCILTTDS